MKFLIHIGLVAVALFLLAQVFPGVRVDSVPVAVIAAIVLSVLHMLVRPVLIILTLPVTILTLGLFIFVINAFLFATAAWLVPGFFVHDFLSALIGALVVSVAGMIANSAK